MSTFDQIAQSVARPPPGLVGSPNRAASQLHVGDSGNHEQSNAIQLLLDSVSLLVGNNLHNDPTFKIVVVVVSLLVGDKLLSNPIFKIVFSLVVEWILPHIKRSGMFVFSLVVKGALLILLHIKRSGWVKAVVAGVVGVIAGVIVKLPALSGKMPLFLSDNPIIVGAVVAVIIGALMWCFLRD